MLYQKASVEDKEEFYGRLQDLLSDINERDVTLLIEDLNSKIGEDNTGYEQVAGGNE